MGYLTGKYYSKDANGKIILWGGEVPTEYAVSIIRTGYLGGKIRTISNQSKIGDGYDHRVKRMVAKAKLKSKQGYKRLDELISNTDTSSLIDDKLYNLLDERLSVNKTDALGRLKPMKAKQWKDSKRKYPMICQPKINGHRMCATLVRDVDGMFATNKAKVKLLTKNGHEYKLDYVTDNLPESLFDGNTVLDGEAYVHNEILSNIKKRLSISKDGVKFSRNSLDSHNVLFMIFDLSIPDVSQIDRIMIKNTLLEPIKNTLWYNVKTNSYDWYSPNTEVPIVNVMGTIINSDAEAYKHLEAALNSGFEGIVLRSMDDEYYFGGRRANMIKLKKTFSSEFEILDVIVKNEDSIRTYISFKCKNDINDLTFEVTPEGNEQDRQDMVADKKSLIGKKANCTFYERTVTGLPFHAVARIREEWDLHRDDLQIE